MRLDPAEWLAAAAEFPLHAPPTPTGTRRVLAGAPFECRLIALAVDGFVVGLVGLIGALVLSTALWDVLFQADGPPFDLGDLDNNGACLILMTWSVLALAYTSVEAFGYSTFGKWVAALRLVAPGPTPRRRLVVRWALSYLPLIALSLFWGSVLAWTLWHRARGGSGDFAPGDTLGTSFLILLAFIALFWPLSFVCACETGGRTLAERASGTQVYSTRPPPPTPGERRGFQVVSAAADERL